MEQARNKESLYSDLMDCGDSLRSVEFSFRQPHRLDTVLGFDLVVDDGYLAEGELPIRLDVLGSKEALDREFSHLELSGGPLRSALPALLAQATWDPSADVRVSAIGMIGKMVQEQVNAGSLMKHELEGIHEALQQLSRVPLNLPPVLDTQEESPVALPIKEGTPAGAITQERVRLAIVKCLDQPAFGEFRPSISDIFSVLKSMKDPHLSFSLIEHLHDRVLENYSSDERQKGIEKQLDVLHELPNALAADLLGRLRERSPEFVEERMRILLGQRKPLQAEKLLRVINELYEQDIPFRKGFLELILREEFAPGLKLVACKLGASTEALIDGLSDSHKKVRAACGDQLQRRTLSDENIALIGEYLQAERPRDVRRIAATILCQLEDTTAASPRLLSGLTDRDSKVCNLSALALARSHDLTAAFLYSRAALKQYDSSRKYPVIIFLYSLDRNQSVLPANIFPLLSDIVSSPIEPRKVREVCTEIIVRHAEPEYSKRVLLRLRSEVGPTMKEFLNDILKQIG